MADRDSLRRTIASLHKSGLSFSESMEINVDPFTRFIVKRFHNPDGEDQHYFSFLNPNFNFHSIGSTSIIDVDQNLAFPFLNEFKPFRVRFSICLGRLYVEGRNCQIGIWNLNTKEYKFLCQPYMKSKPSSTSIFGSGFGYDVKSGDFKVIRFYTHFNYEKDKRSKEERLISIKSVAEVYSLLNDRWKKITDPEATLCFQTYAYVHDTGNYYWIGITNSGTGIVSFNFTSETFSYYTLPPTEIHKSMHTLVGYNSCLFAISYKRSATQAGKALLPGESKVFEIWELDSNSGSWDMHFHVVLNDVEKAVGLKNNMLFLEGRSGSDNLCELLVYDLITGEMKATGIFDYAGKMKIADYVCPNGSGTSTDMESTSSTDESSSQSSLSAQFSLIRM